MVDPRCAALDPIFWLHHANIDRLWNRWLALDNGSANPDETAWLDQSFTFRDETGAAVTLTGAQIVDSAEQLHYVYDDQPPAQDMAVSMNGTFPTPREPAEPPEMVAATEQTVDLVGDARSIQLTVPPSTVSLLASDDVRTGARALYLNVEDIEAEQNPGVVYVVFLNMASDDPGADRARHHVGNVTLFGIEQMNDPDAAHPGVPGLRHTFDVTRVVGELNESRPVGPERHHRDLRTHHADAATRPGGSHGRRRGNGCRRTRADRPRQPLRVLRDHW
ncbi:MAG: hypothetical protein GEV09_21915 [Pseudonocardiaceae bacterium]|nr:hypothetical protein [Pseudonocardiaceae bacterium]